MGPNYRSGPNQCPDNTRERGSFGTALGIVRREKIREVLWTVTAFETEEGRTKICLHWEEPKDEDGRQLAIGDGRRLRITMAGLAVSRCEWR